MAPDSQSPRSTAMSLEKGVTAALGFALASILAIGVLQYLSARRFEVDSQWVSHTQDVIREIEATQKSLSTSDARVQAFVITGNTNELGAIDDATHSMRTHFKTLHTLTADNLSQQQRQSDQEALITKALDAFQDGIGARKTGPLSQAQASEMIGKIDGAVGDVRESLSAGEAEEFQLLQQRKQKAEESNGETNLLMLAGSILAIILVAIAGVGLHFDIAHRRRAESSLRATEERFRLMVEAVKDYAIYMLDPEGRITTWNTGAERLKGYKADEIIGRHFSCFFIPEDARAGKPQQALEAAARDGRWESEGWRVCNDGSRFWADAVLTPIRNDAGELIGFTKITRDFTERNRASRALESEVDEKAKAQRELQVSENALRSLSLHLLRAQDEERRRIGRDLHDSVGQNLSVLMLKLETLIASLTGSATDEIRTELRQCNSLAEESIKEIRTISYLLYPPMLEEVGLKAAVPWYLDGFSKRSGIETTFEISDDFGRLRSDVEVALFRILQESLTNIHKHSESPTADVRLLRRDHQVVLEVIDKGKGVPAGNLEELNQGGALGVGLRGMNERMRQLGGTLEVSSGGGTKVRAVVSIEEKTSPQHATSSSVT